MLEVFVFVSVAERSILYVVLATAALFALASTVDHTCIWKYYPHGWFHKLGCGLIPWRSR
jgi:hypothetical protein